MSSYPQLTVKVAFGSNPNDSTLVWTDITGWARKLKTSRGRTRLLRSQAQFEAGTLSGELDNRDRRFDPTNTAGPYYPNVEPERVIQVGATWQGRYYPIWTGLVDDWPQTWPGFSEGNVQLVATDLFKSLAIKRVLSAGYEQKVTGDGPLGYWRLGEPPPVQGSTVQTSVAADSSGNHNDAAYAGTVTLGTTGALVTDPNTAISVSGTGWVLPPAAANIPSSSTSNATVEFWMRATSIPTAVQMLWQQAGTAVVDDIAAIYLATSGKVAVEMYSGSAQILSTGGTSGVGPVVCDGIWHHIVVVFAAGSTIYVDGVQVDPGTGQSGTWSWTASSMVAAFGGSRYAGNGAFYPGGTTPAKGPQFHGDLDELAVYAVALSSTQVLAHYQGAAFPAETSGQRVGRVLDVLGQPASRRRIATGRTWCQQELTNENQTKALLYLQRCEQTEQGQLYIGADGAVVFEDRYARYTNPDATAVAVIGDGGQGHLVAANLDPPIAFDLPDAWWRLADPAGSATAADSALASNGLGAGGHTGTVQGGVTFQQTGPTAANPAALFNGTTGDVAIDATQFGANALTLEAWVKTSEANAPIFYGPAPSYSGDPYPKQIELCLVAGQVAFGFCLYGGGTSRPDVGPAFVGPMVNDGAWHHLVGVLTNTSGTYAFTVWVDGRQVGSASGTYTISPFAGTGYLGRDPAAGTWLAGSLAECVIYDSALDPARILVHYQSATPQTEIPYSMGGITVNFDRMELYNEIPVTRQGGNTQVAVNQASIAKYADRTMIGGLFDLLMASDQDALYCAQWILADTAYPQLRVGDIRVDPNADPRLWQLVLAYDIGTVFTVNKHNIPGGGPPISVNVRVEGIEHSIDPPRSWTVIWHLSVQGTQPWLILDDPVMGVLDGGARWGW